VLAAIILAWLLTCAPRLLKNRLASRKDASTFSIALDSAVIPVAILIVVESIIFALMSITPLESWKPGLEKAGIGTIIVIATYGLARIVNSLIVWQLTRLRGRFSQPLDLGVSNYLKRITQVIIYAVGLLFLLDYLGISISPLIASLGIGGLAVALALQPTLGNFFAGTQVISDRVARIGDFIELDEKTRGYVTDIGWRSTRIRTPYNNIVIIPNSILANSQVTNYNIPSPAVAIKVDCGVSYDSDLARVKELALEVANQIVESMDEAVKTFEPLVAFDNFGDSNVGFWVWMQAKDRLSAFNLKHGLIVRLHERFKLENITINYPVRTTYLKWPGGIIPEFPRNNKN
jgi:small-conductance mechanosensitive channel